MYKKTKIIAEPAIYWHGDRNLLNNTVNAAASCDCDIFKIQWFDTKYMGNAWKHKKPFYEKCELSIEDVGEINRRCMGNNMDLLITANQPIIIDRMMESSLRNVKLASGQLEEKMVDKLAEYKDWDRIVISTGMLEDYSRLEWLKKLDGKTKELVVMHCVSLYPHDDSETNLTRIQSLQRFLCEYGIEDVKMGFSDHSSHDMACLAAISMGVDYVERHFRLPESYGPTSHIASYPEEMKRLTMYRERLSMIRGNGNIEMNERERPNLERYSTRWLLV